MEEINTEINVYNTQEGRQQPKRRSFTDDIVNLNGEKVEVDEKNPLLSHGNCCRI